MNFFFHEVVHLINKMQKIAVSPKWDLLGSLTLIKNNFIFFKNVSRGNPGIEPGTSRMLA